MVTNVYAQMVFKEQIVNKILLNLVRVVLACKFRSDTNELDMIFPLFRLEIMAHAQLSPVLVFNVPVHMVIQVLAVN